MLNRAEFEVGKKVSYWNGETFFKATIYNLSLNPITNVVEYLLVYKTSPSSKGVHKIISTPFNIKNSKYFIKEKQK